MLSSKLIRMIESHTEQITAEAIQRVRHDPELSHLKTVSDSELRAGARHILKHLGDWLAESDDRQVASCYQGLGKQRYEESIPLDEIVRNYQNLKDLIVSYVRNQGVRETTLEIYAEEELEHLLSRFFDKVIYQVVRGYEGARHLTEVAGR